MKYTAIVALAVAMLVSASAPALAESAQQSRMKDCNAQAKGKSGDERKAFMRSCLSAKPAAPAATAAAPVAGAAMSKSGKPLTAQQMKMKDCNAQAKGMKIADRRKFMSSCLKK
jgi:psiF repeat